MNTRICNTTRAWAEISTQALRNNFLLAKKLTDNRKVMPVIKGDAHGHGAVMCGRVMQEAGADAFAVASLTEAIELREGGITVPILILGWTDPALFEELVSYNLIQSGLALEYAAELSELASKAGRTIEVHAKLDTGMSRTGIMAQNDASYAADQVIQMANLPGIYVTGIFTHYAVADVKEKDEYTAWQVDNYKKVLEELKKKGFDRPLIRHTGNSASIMWHPETYFDMVREGVMMYGFYPDGVYVEDGPLDPVLALKARVAQVKDIKKGTCVSYGCTFTAEEDMTIAVITAGYADSYPRILSNKGAWGMINEQKCMQVGRICMDMCMFDVTGKDVKAGDEIILYGRGGMPLDKVAELTGSINCEPTCLLTNRVKKIYI